MTYTEAVGLAMQGQERGFGFLYENTYKSKLYLALQYMKNEEDAQDVLQDAYIKAFSRLDSLQDPEKFSAWFGQIVANTAKNALVKKNPVLFSDIASEPDDEPFEFRIEDEDTSRQPELAYTKEETRQLVRELMDSLSEEQRICVLMFHIEGASIKEIAEALDCSENTVKSRLNYGRNNIKKKAEDLQKKGYKLYNLAPLPLLLLLFRKDAYAMSAEKGFTETGGRIADGVFKELPSAGGTAARSDTEEKQDNDQNNNRDGQQDKNRNDNQENNQDGQQNRNRNSNQNRDLDRNQNGNQNGSQNRNQNGNHQSYADSPGTSGAGTAAGAGAGKAAGTGTGKAAAAGLLHTAAGKALVAVLAVAVVGGSAYGIAGMNRNNSGGQPVAGQEGMTDELSAESDSEAESEPVESESEPVESESESVESESEPIETAGTEEQDSEQVYDADAVRTLYEEVLQNTADGKYTYPIDDDVIEGYYYFVADMDDDSVPELVVAAKYQYSWNADPVYMCFVFDVESGAVKQLDGSIDVIYAYMPAEGYGFLGTTEITTDGLFTQHIHRITIENSQVWNEQFDNPGIDTGTDEETQFKQENPEITWTEISDYSGLDGLD